VGFAHILCVEQTCLFELTCSPSRGGTLPWDSTSTATCLFVAQENPCLPAKCRIASGEGNRNVYGGYVAYLWDSNSYQQPLPVTRAQGW
jgi:hypothetical protein